MLREACICVDFEFQKSIFLIICFEWLDDIIIITIIILLVNMWKCLYIITKNLLDSGWGSRAGGAGRPSVVSQSCWSCHCSNGNAFHLRELLLAHPKCFAAARWALATIMETLYYHNGEWRCHIWCSPDWYVCLSWEIISCAIVTMCCLCFCRHLLGISALTWCSCIALRFYWPVGRNPGWEVFTRLPLKSSTCRHSTNFWHTGHGSSHRHTYR